MGQFNQDADREQRIGRYLDRYLYARIVDDFRRKSDKKSQNEGVDVVVSLPDIGPVQIDEKAQIDYLNDPVPTFVLELFDDTYHQRDSVKCTEGWYLDDSLQTDYYLFVWPLAVSNFKVRRIHPDEELLLVYRPPSAEWLYHRVGGRRAVPDYLMRQDDKWKCYLEDGRLGQFEDDVEHVPHGIAETDTPPRGKKHFDPENIHELGAVLVEKKRIKAWLTDQGLTDNVLREKARTVARQQETSGVSVDYGPVHLAYSNRQGENPVNLVVRYDLYHRLAHETYRIRPDGLARDVRVFD